MNSNRTTLKRDLRLRDLMLYGLQFIGPLSVVPIIGPLDARSGGAIVTVYLVAALATSLTAVSYAQMSMAVPRAGSVFAYASAGFGPRTGFMAGWVIMLDYMLIPGLAYLGCGLALGSIFPAVPIWIFSGAAVLITALLNSVGVRVAVRVLAAVLGVEMIALVAVLIGAAFVLVGDGPARPWLSPLTGMGGFSAVAVLGGVSVAVLSFLGFDGIAALAEENVGIPRQVAKAILACLGVATTLFILQSYVGAVLTPLTPAEVAANPELQGILYYDMVGTEISTWLAWALGVTKAIGTAFTAMVAAAAGSRLLFSMAREGRLPRALAVVSPSTGTPVRASLVVSAFTLLVALWAANAANGLELLASMVNVGALAAFAMLHLSVIALFVGRRGSRRLLVHLLVPAAGFLVIVTVLFYAHRTAQLIAAAWALIGIVVLMLQRSQPTEPTADALDRPFPADVPSTQGEHVV